MRWRKAGPIMLAALAFHVFGAVTMVIVTPFPAPIDELAHYSYVVETSHTGALLPFFPDMRLWDIDTGTWTDSQNYLGHPSPYYHLMALLADWLGPAGPADAASITVLRYANAALSTVAVALILVAGMALFSGTAERVLFASAVVLFPKLAVLGGIINNDNLALVSGALAFAGLALGVGSRGGLTMLAAGVVLAGWTKLTALLMVAIAAGTYELITVIRSGRLQLQARHALLAAALVAAAVPYVWNLMQFGSPVYSSGVLQAELLGEDNPVRLDIADYAVFFAKAFALKWAALQPANAVQMLGFAMALVLIVIGLVYAAYGASTPAADDRARTLGLAYAAALLFVLPLHFWHSWRGLLITGHILESYSRYYYVLWPGLAVAFALSLPALKKCAAAMGRPRIITPSIWIVAVALLFIGTIQFVFVFRDGVAALAAMVT